MRGPNWLIRRLRSPALPSSRRPGRASRVLGTALFVATVATGLWFAVHRSAGATGGSRVDEIAARLRCPSCVDESAAEADTPAAKAIRADIAARLGRGQSAQQIVDYMVSRYGRWILLSPPTSGVDAIVWVAPVAVVIGAAGVVGVAFRRAIERNRARPLSEDDRDRVEAALEAFLRDATTGSAPSSARSGPGPLRTDGSGAR